ncbi:MAG: DUF4244 domain-containing protein [Propionibacteriaceae bacterium]|nr:DUF4244 domain-containing protein [Propionibacteriaceae bacterium]
MTGAAIKLPGLRRRGQRGMVTVELAIGLIVVVMLLAILVGVILLGVTQSHLEGISSDLAKHIARGDEVTATKVRERAPADARIEVVKDEAGVWVTTRLDVSILNLGSVPLEAAAWARWEPGEGP